MKLFILEIDLLLCFFELLDELIVPLFHPLDVVDLVSALLAQGLVHVSELDLELHLLKVQVLDSLFESFGPFCFVGKKFLIAIDLNFLFLNFNF